MARGAVRRGIAPELALAALVGAAALPLTRLFRAGGFGTAAVLTIVTALSVSWALRRLGIPPMLAWVWSALAFVWFAAAMFATETLFGPFPTADSLRALGRAADEAVRQAVEQTAPVPAADPVLLAAAAGIWITAVLADTALIGAQNPLLAVAATLPLFSTAGSIVTTRRLAVEAAFFLAAATLVVHAGQRDRASRRGWQPAAVARIAMPAIALAVLLGQALPGIGAPPGLKDRVPGGGVRFNPLVAIRPTLDLTPTQVLFTVRTSSPTYMRLTALDRFDGRQWSESPRRLLPIERARPGTRPIPFDVVAQRVRIDGLAGDWLPAAFEPANVSGPSQVDVDLESRALVVPGALPRGASYRIESAVPRVDATDLERGDGEGGPVPAGWVSLPGSVPGSVRTAALDITRGARTRLDKAVAIQNHLRGFTYDASVAAGHSYDSVEGFLEVKRGYCEQFAGTMAVLARAVGIPARVAIGFGIGRATAPGTYEVTTNEAHAWVEVFFPEAGWIAFEPTPRAGIARPPSYAQPPAGPADPGERTDAAEDESPPRDRADPRLPDEGDDAGAEAAEGAGGAWLPASIALGGAVVLALVAAAVPALVRRRRLRRIRDPVSAVRARYVDFLGWCEAAGLGRRPGETPSEHAARLAGAYRPAASQLSRTADAATVALWAPPNGLDAAGAARSIAGARAALARSLSPPRRALAAAGWGRWRAPR